MYLFITVLYGSRNEGVAEGVADGVAEGVAEGVAVEDKRVALEK